MMISDLADLCSGISEATVNAESMESAASALVRYLRESFVDPRTAESEIVLARAFQTVRYDALTPELKEFVDARATEPVAPTQRCLVLMGTDGDEPAWTDRQLSRDHQAIPLSSVEQLRAMPMVAALVDHLGVSIETFMLGTADDEVYEKELEVFYVPVAKSSPEVPGQQFVEKYDVRSVLGFGGVLPGGDVFAVIMFTRNFVASQIAGLFRTVAVAAKLALLPALTLPLLEGLRDRVTDQHAVALARVSALEQMLQVQRETVLNQAFRLEDALRDALEARQLAERETEATKALVAITSQLSAELDVDRLVQSATDAATAVTGASFGAFFYNSVNDEGEIYQLYTLSGVPREAFERFPMPRNTEVFAPTFRGEGVIRRADITKDPTYGRNPPYKGLPRGHLPVRSYLAVPVVTSSGEVRGAFFFGHPEVGVFDEAAERSAIGIAAQTAIALDNARLYQAEKRTALALQRSLLPSELPAPDGLQVAYEYLAGGGGADVGGDWFDVIPLAGGRAAFVIGDVMGRGIKAAAVMGQLRTAIRAYTVSDLSPEVLVGRLNQLVIDMGEDLIATCIYAILDQTDGTLTVATAGHLPMALIREDGSLEMTGTDLGPPLGVPGAIHRERKMEFPVGSRMLLFTDGLVEHRERPVDEGLQQLAAVLETAGSLREGPADLCRTAIAGLMGSLDQDDDVTVLAVANTGLSRRDHASRLFPAEELTGSQARRWVAQQLESWGDGLVRDDVLTVTHELVINAVLHAHSPITVQLRRLPSSLVVEVADHDGRLPRRTHAAPTDETFRGLQIVETLADRWGARVTEQGKVVWAEFRLS